MSKKMTYSEFLVKAKDAWGDVNDYSKSVYINSYTPISVRCVIHDHIYKVKPSLHLSKTQGCDLCAKENRKVLLSHPHKTFSQVKEELIAIWGDDYDFSKFTIYTGVNQKIEVFCKKCNSYFERSVGDLLNKRGCQKCARRLVGEKRENKPNKNARRLILGVGINDIDVCARNNKCYEIWHSILQRTVDEKYKMSHKAYSDATVCEKWLTLSNFNIWFDDNYIEGYNIDKDLLGCDKKEYSPETCVFIPNEINAAISREKRSRDLPIGVMRHKDRFKAVCIGNYLGIFDTVSEAREAYLKAKKEHITYLANKWKEKIEPRAYEALINLDVDNFFNNK